MRIAASHPALPGHFPGHPVVPGVVLLEAVAAALPQHARATGFPVVKFLAPLLPEHEFEVTAGDEEKEFTFSVDTPGTIEVESHGLEVTVLKLEVS